MAPGPKGIIDTCCLINLCAVGNVKQWLPSLEYEWHVPSAVASETLYLRDWDREGRPIEREIDLRELLDAGTLVRCGIETPRETELYVRFATDLSDGEAMALAIAKSRHFALATDDRKAIRIATEEEVEVVSTPELMKRWADAAAPDAREVRQALMRIQTHARYVPRRDAPESDWWFGAVKG